MHVSEYQNIYKSEGSHFYYVGIHNLILRLLSKYLVKKQGNKILDAGCGTGLLAQKMSRFGKITGIDISQDAVKYAKKRGVDAIFGTVVKLPFKENTFDAIVSIDVLYHQHVDSDVKAVNEFHRVLKPDGILILKNPAYNWLRGKHDKIVQTKKRYTTQEIGIILKQNRFDVIKLTYNASFLLPFVIATRFFENIFNSKAESDVKIPNKLVNNIFILLFMLENNILKYVDLPFGLSVLGVAKKV